MGSVLRFEDSPDSVPSTAVQRSIHQPVRNERTADLAVSMSMVRRDRRPIRRSIYVTMTAHRVCR